MPKDPTRPSGHTKKRFLMEHKSPKHTRSVSPENLEVFTSPGTTLPVTMGCSTVRKVCWFREETQLDLYLEVKSITITNIRGK